jgi:hypothetical protein
MDTDHDPDTCARCVRISRGEPCCATCPGWLITANGDIIPCDACGLLTPEQAYQRAAAWARTLPPAAGHQEHDGCTGCCGFDAFETGGSVVQGDFAILRDNESCVFDGDDAAQAAARELYFTRWTAGCSG